MKRGAILCLLLAIVSPLAGVQEQTGLIAPATVVGACNEGDTLKYRAATKDFGCIVPPSGGGIPAGSILLVNTGSCPTGFTEVAALSGKFLLGTTAGAGDVGTTGGADNITPAGTLDAVSAGTPAGTNAWPVGVPTFSGTPFSSVINHTHAVSITDNGHAHTQSVNSATNGGLSGYTPDTSTNTSVTSGYSTGNATTGISAATQNPGGGVASITPAGTVAWPAGVPTFSGSALGTHGHAFTGSQFDNRPAFTKVIFCSKD